MKETVRLLANKYMADNPVCEPHYRAFYSGGIVRGKDYRYKADLNIFFPDSKTGGKAYIRALYRADGDCAVGMKITLFGRIRMLLNGGEVFRSDVFSERNNDKDIIITLEMKTGENLIEIECTKTPLGFGCIFGTHLAKWDYILFRPDMPDMEGCLAQIEGGGTQSVLEEERASLREGEHALFYTKTRDGRDVIIKKDDASFPDDGEYVNPFGIEGLGAWIGLYPLKNDCNADFIHPTEGTYWRFKYKSFWLRPYYGKSNFGRWNYPLGVVMYGLMRAAEALDDENMRSYVKGHISFAADTLPYALWDREKHGGAASLHNLLCSMDSLDDCGAFGAAVEEAEILYGMDFGRVREFAADYILHRQPRTEKGAFCRKNQLHSFHNDTMWLDDLYMSVPFLVRFYALTGDKAALDDAARQFFLYREMLQMDNKLLSHVFDFRHGMRNGVAWGRGNGWALFSLTELLSVLPAEHPERAEAEAFFRELCEAYAPYQSEDGRWRQVIDEEDAYLETSVSAMFACSFFRGVRMGLLDKSYAERARRAAESIAENCIDSEGNLFGVCRGSEFSFSSDYYKYDLTPRVNDTHGVGIALLAMCEYLKGVE